MSECHLIRCQQERKYLRREFNKWTKNLLLQIGLETMSNNYFQFDINSFEQNDDEQRIPNDFNPDQTCLFCLNREDTNPSNISLNEHPNSIEIEDENSPLDLSLKSTTNSNSRLPYSMDSDLLPTFNSDVFFPSNYMNFDYLSQSFAHANLFPSMPMDHYGTNSSLTDHYVTQLAKQMAYVRMVQEIQNQEKMKETNHSLDTSSILTESLNINQIMTDIMTRTLHEIYEEQIKQSKRMSKQGELLYVKKPTNDHSDTAIHKNNQQHKHRKEITPSTSNLSTNSSPSIPNKSKSNPSTLAHVSSRRQKESIANDGKQSRPKRGQYRRYESEQLAKAVTAVLSNEMSVHKAGSYFGVPHSTLEYKVKERYSKTSSAKTKTNHSSSDALQAVSSTSDEMTPNDSMDYDNIDEDNKLSSSNHAKNGENLVRNDREYPATDFHDQLPSTNLIPSERT